jgi:hypothetical protein
VAYVTFATEGQRDEILARYQLDGASQQLRSYYNILKKAESESIEILGKRVVIEMACEPTDVFWEHQGISTYKKICSRIGSFIFDTLVALVLFSLVIFLLYT